MPYIQIKAYPKDEKIKAKVAERINEVFLNWQVLYMNKNHKRINHPIPPVFDENSEILILGSFPSVKSREQGFFYGHPQNRFWKVTAAVFE